MELNLDDRAKLRELSQEYQDSSLAQDNNNYFEEKPYFKEHCSANKWAKNIALLGHMLSIVIGSGCGYLIGFALFSGFDMEIYKGITIGALLGIAFVLTLTSLWELIKHKFIHSFFKSLYQFKRKYTGWKDYSKLLILFGGSLVLSGYGGFEVVSNWFGKPQTTQTTMVDVNSKTQHITDAIAAKQSTIDTLETGQQIYISKGKLRRIKIDNRIAGIEDDITVLNTALLASVEKWDDHNTKADGATTASNDAITASHGKDKIWYALLFGLCAMIADLITLYTIRYNERYKYRSHLEMVGVSWFLNQQQKRGQKMEVVYRSETIQPNKPPKPTGKPVETTQQTTDGLAPAANQSTQTNANHKPTHGDMFWSDGLAYMWYRKQTDGSLVTKKATELKQLRNKATGRANSAKSDETRNNNEAKASYYDGLYKNLVLFQNSNKKIV